MYIKLIDFGGTAPVRAHYNDAGADVFAHIIAETCDNYEDLSVDIPPYSIRKIPLGIGLQLPDGFAAFILPRSGKASNGLTAEVVPIDSGYTGQIHAILHNTTENPIRVYCGDKIAQLVIIPVILANFSFEDFITRGDAGFGSTDKK